MEDKSTGTQQPELTSIPIFRIVMVDGSSICVKQNDVIEQIVGTHVMLQTHNIEDNKLILINWNNILYMEESYIRV